MELPWEEIDLIAAAAVVVVVVAHLGKMLRTLGLTPKQRDFRAKSTAPRFKIALARMILALLPLRANPPRRLATNVRTTERPHQNVHRRLQRMMPSTSARIADGIQTTDMKTRFIYPLPSLCSAASPQSLSVPPPYSVDQREFNLDRRSQKASQDKLEYLGRRSLHLCLMRS